MKLALVLPDVNSGEFRFTVNKRGEVVYGLGAIKGIGEGPVESIVAARTADGEFRDLFDFCTRTDPRRVNKRVLEALIRSGAMDGLGASRAVLMAAMAEALKAAEQRARNLDVGLMDMFADNAPASTGEDVYAAFRAAAEWSARERLRGEKETLGLYVTGHPIDDHEAEIAQNLAVMSRLRTPIICVVIGEGSSGGALGIGVGDHLAMLQYSTYFVISPEGCANIIWKTSDKAPEAAEAMGVTSTVLQEMGIVDATIPEPLGGAHRDVDAIAARVQEHLLTELQRLKSIPLDELCEIRFQRLMSYGSR